MSVCGVSWLDLLHELCLQNGYALLLTAEHTPPGFAEPSRTAHRHLSVVEPAPLGTAIERLAAGAITKGPQTRRHRIRAGELIARIPTADVDGDLEAAAELLVQLLTRALRKAA